MPYSIDTSRYPDTFIVSHHGRVAANEFQDIVRDLDSINPDRSKAKLLVDIRPATAFPSKADFLNFMQGRYAQAPMPARIALISPPAFLDVVDFIVVASRNRGAVIRHFSNEADALIWLFDDDAGNG